ncbi:filamentous hemagglutinin family protein, partial [Acinetobacter baumannii]
RGAKTARSTAAPKKIAVTVESKDADGKPITLIVGYRYEIPVDAAGSGIQTATSDPDGSGPLKSPAPGSVYLFAPKGTIDAG